ncbi:hypothetical protein LCGC14_3124310 [marine sediment metagenome]|uniref:Uncharacterized protein n=1 Tax=marine sediment metagenome TaxID=412755 RepID=A0A0F8W1C8_9ZZZZ
MKTLENRIHVHLKDKFWAIGEEIKARLDGSYESVAMLAKLRDILDDAIRILESTI